MASYPPELGHGEDTQMTAGGDHGASASPAVVPRPAFRSTKGGEPAESTPETLKVRATHQNGNSAAPAARSRRKRALDIGLTVAALPVVLFLCLLITLLVATTSRGPVLFRQERLGFGGRRFRMVKFRTMQVDAETRLRADPKMWDEYVRNDFKLPAETDSRVTAVGRFLRRSSLDELPQLANVLRGHMSLVGPRPIVPEEIERYGSDQSAYLSVRPGITGTWQVNGRSGVGYPDRTVLDREYVESWTLWTDICILLRTPFTVLSKRGAH